MAGDEGPGHPTGGHSGRGRDQGGQVSAHSRGSDGRLYASAPQRQRMALESMDGRRNRTELYFLEQKVITTWMGCLR